MTAEKYSGIAENSAPDSSTTFIYFSSPKRIAHNVFLIVFNACQ
jgi:hypothetical protein